LLDDLINNQLRFPGRTFRRLNANVRDGKLGPNTEVLDFCEDAAQKKLETDHRMGTQRADPAQVIDTSPV
jgi:hypothetical protein